MKSLNRFLILISTLISFILFLMLIKAEARKPTATQGNSKFNKKLEKIGSVDGKAFYIGRTKMFWAEALDFCHLKGMELASVLTEEENDLICDHLSENKIDFAWLSAIDLFAEGVWRWLRSMEKVNYSNWERFEMKVTNKEHNCALIQGDGLWFTASCSLDMNYPICHLKKSSKRREYLTLPESNESAVNYTDTI